MTFEKWLTFIIPIVLGILGYFFTRYASKYLDKK